jgi:hypothetical protein
METRIGTGVHTMRLSSARGPICLGRVQGLVHLVNSQILDDLFRATAPVDGATSVSGDRLSGPLLQFSSIAQILIPKLWPQGRVSRQFALAILRGIPWGSQVDPGIKSQI